MMNHFEFVLLVRDYREAQKAYLQERTRTALGLVKQLERRIDGYVLQAVNETPQQGRLLVAEQ
jgi:hypothetical protein